MSSDLAPEPTSAPPPPRLLDQLRQAARHAGHPELTRTAFADWSRRFSLFHGNRHPRDPGLAEIGQFLPSSAQTDLRDEGSACWASRCLSNPLRSAAPALPRARTLKACSLPRFFDELRFFRVRLRQ
jgi:hypothetical protein